MRQITKGKVLAAALVLAGITGVLVYWFFANQAKVAQAHLQVVVAAQEIPRNAVITGEMLRTATMQQDAIQPGTATTPEMVIGRIANDQFESGEPILVDATLAGNRFANRIPPFMRAVTVALDPIIGVAGFLQPGDHVDVVATFMLNNGTVTKTVLQDVELLATGAQVVAGDLSGVERVLKSPNENKGEKPQAQPNATLAVLPTDAEKLILAESKGKLRLTLRRPSDISFVQTRGVTGRAVIGPVPPDVPQPGQAASTVRYAPASPMASAPSSAMYPQPLPLPAPVRAEKTVMVIRGTKVEEAVVQE